MKIALALVLLLPACGSLDRRLYEEGDPPTLRDGTVRMITHWRPGRDEPKDLRVIRARAGVITCSHISRAHGHFEGTADAAAWRKLWTRLFAARPFTAHRPPLDPADPRGGPYHEIQLQLGDHSATFTAQLRTNALIFSTGDILERMEYANAIVNFVAEHALTKLPAESPPGESGKPPKQRKELPPR